MSWSSPLERAKTSLEHARIKSDFAHRLELVTPYMRAMADQVLNEPNPQERWSSLWVDDKGGRLPGLFMHRVLKNAGVSLPVKFAMGGRQARRQYEPQLIDSKFDHAAASYNGAKSALLVTDTVAMGNAANYLAGHLSRTHEGVDIATVAQWSIWPSNLPAYGKVYSGGVGRKALLAANGSFETVLFAENSDGTSIRGHLKNIWKPKTPEAAVDHRHTYPLGGIDDTPHLGEIHGHRPADHSYQDVVVFARQQIATIADEYSQSR